MPGLTKKKKKAAPGALSQTALKKLEKRKKNRTWVTNIRRAKPRNISGKGR